MKFDVIIGNPPYQMSDGGHGTSASPLYHTFVEQAKKLNPRFLTMVIPSRWFAGGKGLDSFRTNMLNDNRISHLIDYFDASECFPGVDISGGICYFLWQRDNIGSCEVKTVRNGSFSVLNRSLLEERADSFIRFNEAISIIKKINARKENSFIDLVSSRKPFGITTTIKPKDNKNNDDIKIYAYPKIGYIDMLNVPINKNWTSMWKVFVAKAYGERGAFPYMVIGKPFLGEPDTCCSETYLLIGPCEKKLTAENIISYMKTRLFRLLVLLKKNTQNSAKNVYSFVPIQDFSEPWTDEKLYEKYGLTQEEIDFIESMIRPMDNTTQNESVAEVDDE